MKCSMSDWGCVYHACMSDDCQKKVVQDQGSNWGIGRCEKSGLTKNHKSMKTLYFKHKKKNGFGFWQLEDGDENQVGSIHSRTKIPALRSAKRYCREKATKDSPISLRIIGRDGKFKDENTYPRSADPKKSKG